MPNRKTFDEREKYDHSKHRTSGAEAGDLAPLPEPADDNSANSAGDRRDRVVVPAVTPNRR